MKSISRDELFGIAAYRLWSKGEPGVKTARSQMAKSKYYSRDELKQ
jgi:hypothetical protein